MAATELGVILAGGMGIRMGDLGRLRPKGLIELGHIPIIEESILRLIKAGVGEIIIVTGHLSEQFIPMARKYSGVVRTLHNAHYQSGGSLSSLLRACEHIHGDFLLLESDLIFESRALKLLQTSRLRDVILASGPTGAGDEVWVAVDGNGSDVVVGMSKKREELPGRVAGELSGITRLSAAAAKLLRQRGENLAGTVLDYESALVVIAQEAGLRCMVVDDLVWAEMDTLPMIERARARIYPWVDPVTAFVPHGTGAHRSTGPTFIQTL